MGVVIHNFDELLLNFVRSIILLLIVDKGYIQCC